MGITGRSGRTLPSGNRLPKGTDKFDKFRFRPIMA